MGLTEPQIQRYARHVLLPDVGGVGQARLLAAAVRVDLHADFAGAVAAATYLAAAGVGTIVLAGDAARAVTAQDVVGGIALGEDDLGSPVGDALAARLVAINPDVRVTCDDIVGAHALVNVIAEAPGDDLPGGVAGSPAPEHAVIADALVRGGAAAARVIHRIATTS